MCLSLCLCAVSIQCQSLLPLSPVPAHPTTSTRPALRCPSPPPLLAMASAPPPVANSRPRLSLSSSCPLPVLATHPERCPRASASRSTSSYWREASHCLQEPSVLSPSPVPRPRPPLHLRGLTLLLRLPAALPQTLPLPLRANATQVCVNTVNNSNMIALDWIPDFIFIYLISTLLWCLCANCFTL